jgi:hypothetical protein
VLFWPGIFRAPLFALFALFPKFRLPLRARFIRPFPANSHLPYPALRVDSMAPVGSRDLPDLLRELGQNYVAQWLILATGIAATV